MIWFFIDIYFYEDYWLLQQDIKYAIATWIANSSYLGKEQKCYHPCTINLNGIPLDRVTEFKYITAGLSWTTHITMICTKARRLIGVLSRCRYLHPKAALCL